MGEYDSIIGQQEQEIKALRAKVKAERAKVEELDSKLARRLAKREKNFNDIDDILRYQEIVLKNVAETDPDLNLN